MASSSVSFWLEPAPGFSFFSEMFTASVTCRSGLKAGLKQLVERDGSTPWLALH
jgi:hypothetical protein